MQRGTDIKTCIFKKKHFFYQLGDFTLQVVNAVELSLPASLSSEAVFTAPSHIVDKLQLFLRKGPLLQQLLEVISAQVHNPVYREGQLHLRTAEQGITVRQEGHQESKDASFMKDRSKKNAYRCHHTVPVCMLT